MILNILILGNLCCYIDFPAPIRDLPVQVADGHPNMTGLSCSNLCKVQNYQYAGVQNG